jgi:hypothetical protein
MYSAAELKFFNPTVGRSTSSSWKAASLNLQQFTVKNTGWRPMFTETGLAGADLDT